MAFRLATSTDYFTGIMDGGRAAKKTAFYNFIQFENFPAGTIYWLRNTTKGKEEQPFF